MNQYITSALDGYYAQLLELWVLYPIFTQVGVVTLILLPAIISLAGVEVFKKIKTLVSTLVVIFVVSLMPIATERYMWVVEARVLASLSLQESKEKKACSEKLLKVSQRTEKNQPMYLSYKNHLQKKMKCDQQILATKKLTVLRLKDRWLSRNKNLSNVSRK